MRMMLKWGLRRRLTIKLVNVAELFLMTYSDVFIENKTVRAKHVKTY